MRGRMRKNFIRIHQRMPAPVLLISHDPEDIKVCAETLVHIEKGRVRRFLECRSRTGGRDVA